MALADQPWVKSHLHVSALLLVILIGMAVRAIVHLPAALEPGVGMAQRPVLRWAVAGLGFKLSLGELMAIGVPALVVVTISTLASLAFGIWIARRLAVPEKLGILLAVGGAVCGASAIVAADSVVQAERRHTALALGVITVLGTAGIVLYPALAGVLHLGNRLYGVWDGASLHEMAQVVAAGFGVSDEAARVATVVKLARIALLAPIVLWLGAWMRGRGGTGQAHVAPVPWFLLLFVAFAIVNSLPHLPQAALAFVRQADLVLLCVGMAGVGLQTGPRELRSAGPRPLVAGVLQWGFLSGTSLALARVLCR